LKVLFLGTGTSMGVPEIACDCDVCRSDNPKNKRLRASILVKIDNKNILIDTTPDFRLQMINNNVKKLDAVLFTHYHADHILGLDDIRRFNCVQNEKIPIYGSKETINEIKRVFKYAFDEDNKFRDFFPKLKVNIIEEEFNINDIRIIPIEVFHGGMKVLGFRIGDFTYITDCNEIAYDSLCKLRGLKVLVLGALRFKQHVSHFTVDDAVKVYLSLRPEKSYLTHMSHDIEHNTVEKYLPKNLHLAYDGLEIEI